MLTGHIRPEPVLEILALFLGGDPVYRKVNGAEPEAFIIKLLRYGKRYICGCVVSLVVIIIDTNNLIHHIAAFPEIEYCSATISQTDTISYGEEYIVGDLRGVSEDYNSIIYINVASQNGRFINKMDMNATRKVIILSPRMAEVLFRNEDPLGKYVKCGNMMYHR